MHHLPTGFSSGSWSDTEEEAEPPGSDDEQSGLDSSTPRGAVRWGRLLMQCLADGNGLPWQASSSDEHSVIMSRDPSGAARWGWLHMHCLAGKTRLP